MIAFEVFVKGERLCLAGVGDHVVLNAILNWVGKPGQSDIFTHVGGVKSTLDGQATGLLVDSVVSSLVVETVYVDTIAQVLGSLPPALLLELDKCLKVGLGLS
jgi:hypothetical protein